MNTQHTPACHGRSKCENTIAALKRMLASEQGALVATQAKYDVQFQQHSITIRLLEEAEQQRDELKAALVKHGKHGIHCRPEYMISTGQIIGYKCVDISCPVAAAIAKAGGQQS